MPSTLIATVWLVVAAICFGLSAVRWVRVAQRENYRTGRVLAVWRAWWNLGPNLVLAVAALAALVGSVRWLPLAAAPLAASALGPLGLRFRGTDPGPLHWDRRAVATVAAAAFLPAVIVVAAVTGGWWGRAVIAAIVAVVLSGLLIAVAAPVGLMLGGPDANEASAGEASGSEGRGEDASSPGRGPGPGATDGPEVTGSGVAGSEVEGSNRAGTGGAGDALDATEAAIAGAPVQGRALPRTGRTLIEAFPGVPVTVAPAPDLHVACDALTRWRAAVPGMQHIVVTPGLSSFDATDADQADLARAVAAEAATLVVVGPTARRAMVAGAASSPEGATVVAADDAEGVASWWREHRTHEPTAVLILGPRGDHRP